MYSVSGYRKKADIANAKDKEGKTILEHVLLQLFPPSVELLKTLVESGATITPKALEIPRRGFFHSDCTNVLDRAWSQRNRAAAVTIACIRGFCEHSFFAPPMPREVFNMILDKVTEGDQLRTKRGAS